MEPLENFTAPNEGSWELDTVHFSRPVTRVFAELFPPALKEGFAGGAKKYGLFLEYLVFAPINGFMYYSLEPVDPSEIPARLEACQEAFDTKRWRSDWDTWQEREKPAAIAANSGIQAVDPGTLTPDALLQHLHECRDNVTVQIRRHHAHTVPSLIPLGDFLVHAGEWSGRPQHELLELMQGSTPESAGLPPRLIEAIAGSTPARELIEAGENNDDLWSALRALPGEVGPLMTSYLDTASYRLVDGLDPVSPYALEVPGMMLAALQSALRTGGSGEHDPLEAKLAAVRAHVPADKQSEFDGLLEEARLTYSLRDERALYCDLWAWGLFRRAVLAVGRGATDAGRLHEPEHLLEASFAEMVSIAKTGDGPSADELSDRLDQRLAATLHDAPALVGPPPPPPPLDQMPPIARRAFLAIGTCLQSVFTEPETTLEGNRFTGVGANAGVFTGPARIVRNPADFSKIQRGDILVASSTTSAFNVLLPLLGAIVTDRGGSLSHAAIVAREYGIPSVVGSKIATKHLTDGMTVRVDGGEGTIEML